MDRVRGKVALVTGGANGIGAAIAQRLAHEGATVVVSDIQERAGEDIASKCGGLFLRQDVTDEERWLQVVRQIEDRYGALHVLVNNAGIEGPFDAADPENTRLSDWRSIQRVNVEGVFLGCRSVIAAIRKSGGGSIINVSSTAALVAGADFMAYGASKATVQHMTKSVALHCARNGSGIRCNSVHPGSILTPMLERIIQQTAKRRGVPVERVMQEAKAAIPQNEFQEPDDVANAVLFLASDESRHITGTALVIDGGMTLQLGTRAAT
jgi:3(or 17)beta-hydroxysteroid dehydrogenase